jgi:hypothetical protein
MPKALTCAPDIGIRQIRRTSALMRARDSSLANMRRTGSPKAIRCCAGAGAAPCECSPARSTGHWLYF